MPVILNTVTLTIPEGSVGSYQPVAAANPAHALWCLAEWVSPATGKQFKVPHFYLTQLDIFPASGINIFYERFSVASVGLACYQQVLRNDGASNPFRIYVRKQGLSASAVIRMRTINMSI